MMRLAIGVDVGGSSVKAGVVDEAGHLRSQFSQPTPATSSAQAVIETIIDTASRARRAAERAGTPVDGVGFGFPEYSVGPDWTQQKCDNIPALEGAALYPVLSSAFGPDIACDLDTHAATLAERQFGAAVGQDRFIFMGIGTGISCGIVANGELLRYTFNTSGDTGHLIVDASAPDRCGCGAHGCLDALASARFIRERGIASARSGSSEALSCAYQRDGEVTARSTIEAAQAGDPVARSILAQAGRYLGIGLASLMHIFVPHLILVGGGVSAAGELLLGPARATIGEYASPFCQKQLQGLRLAALGSEGGIIGAAALILGRGDA